MDIARHTASLSPAPCFIQDGGKMKLIGLDGAIRRLKCNKGGYKKQSGIDCRGAGNPKESYHKMGSPKTLDLEPIQRLLQR